MWLSDDQRSVTSCYGNERVVSFDSEPGFGPNDEWVALAYGREIKIIFQHLLAFPPSSVHTSYVLFDTPKLSAFLPYPKIQCQKSFPWRR